ncbi:DUF6541 family protein [Boudabousia marimammalium]|uniref:Glycosyltransferase RgtA/B/C/D-like domain-containing protein n=1 Tax=Boudabousia marimammalium TaxID=156892 RepID=A0A1Q5PRL3_9ACTO|nr:DUF6541 family protein [Boudabousia marimammalium]OKL50224.1 hypothetical protein BM477_02185 [Boudabousia marimammalium]
MSITFIGLILGAGIWLVLLGYPISRLAFWRNPRIIALCISPFISVSVLGILAIAFDKLGIPWARGNLLLFTLAWVLGFSLILGIATVRKGWRKPVFEWRSVAALILVIIVASIVIMRAIGKPDAFGQSFDSVWHLNLVEWFMHNHTAASTNITMLTATPVFYPAAWHDVISAIALISGVDAVVATNVFTVIVVAVMWPASVYVALTILGHSDIRLTILGVLSSFIFGQFPLLLLYHGILYPTLLSYTYLPLMLGLFIYITRSEYKWNRLVVLLLGAVLVPGIMLSHPSTGVYLFLICLPFIAEYLYKVLRKRISRISKVPALIVAVLLTSGLFLAVNWLTMQNHVVRGLRTRPVDWAAHLADEPIRALVGLFGGTTGFPWPAMNWRYGFLLQLLLLVGIWNLIKSRSWPLVVSFVFAQIMLLAATMIEGPWRSYIYGFWYGDAVRIATITITLNVLVFAYGLQQLAIWVQAFLGLEKIEKHYQHTYLGFLSNNRDRVLALVAVFVIVPALLSPHVSLTLKQIHNNYDYAYDSFGRLLDEDEYKLIERVPETIPEGYRVLGNPWNGSALVQALARRQAVFPHLQITQDPDAIYLAKNLINAKTDPKVCEIVHKYHAPYVLDFGSEYLWGDPATRILAKYDGLRFLDYYDVATIVDREGPKKLLKVTACGEVTPEPMPAP